MATKTYQEQLEEVQAAISAVLVRGQSYTIGDRQFNRGNLGELHTMEKELRVKARRESSGGGIRTSYGVPS